MTRPLLVAALTGSLVILSQAEAAVTAEWASRWRSDLAFLADTLPRVHARLHHTLSREAFQAELDSLGTRLALLEHHEITVELARIIARIGDGHTRLTMPFDTAARFFTGHSPTPPPLVPGLVFRHLPVRLHLFRDGLFVTRAARAHRELLGGRIVEIGDMPVDRAIAAVEPTVQRDNPQQVRHLLPTHLVVPEILHARGVVEDPERVRLVVETARGRRVVVLGPLAPGAATEWLEARLGEPPLVDREPQDRHWFRRIPGTPVLYARYREVMDDPDETVAAFADSLFAALRGDGADRLVLDLRGNPGGNGFLNRSLVRGIVATPSLARPGALFVLADRGTFSAAMMLLAELEQWTAAVIVGETTGARPNGYGDSRRVRLPNSGLTVRASTLYWQKSDPRDAREGIVPHITVEPDFASWRMGRDPVIDTTLALLRAAPTPAGVWRGAITIGHESVPITIRVARQGEGWGVRMDAPGLEAREEALREVRFGGGELGFARRGHGPDLVFRGLVAPRTIVGVARFQGADLPFVLGRLDGNGRD